MAFILSPAARQDLSDIWNYIAAADIDAADRVRDAIFAAIDQLVAMPGMGHLREDLVDEPLRFWRVYSYLIIYRPQTDPLEIVRILSGYRDIQSMVVS
jgi:plasmid stabilization system protein ParE